jgi:hypothetical protein
MEPHFVEFDASLLKKFPILKKQPAFILPRRAQKLKFGLLLRNVGLFLELLVLLYLG